MQYKQGCAVQARMCSRNQAQLQYKQGCVVQARHTPVQARMCSMSEGHLQYKRGLQYKQVDHQVLVQGGTTEKFFPLNESLFLLIYQVKQASNLW